MCGEQTLRLNTATETNGSSPRVRGTDRGYAIERYQDRFIPACAGNSIHKHPARLGQTVHPRVCGEQLTTAARGYTNGGSSPRVRGTVQIGKIVIDDLRFIPACAGNSLSSSDSSAQSVVHPRVCGEQIPLPRNKGL